MNACAQKAQKNEKLQLSEDSKVVSGTICHAVTLLHIRLLKESDMYVGFSKVAKHDIIWRRGSVRSDMFRHVSATPT